MEQEAILAFRQYVEALGKAHAIRQYMKQKTEVNILGLDREIHVYEIGTLKELATEYKEQVVMIPAAAGLNYKTYASFQAVSREYGMVFTVFCYTDRKSEAES